MKKTNSPIRPSKTRKTAHAAAAKRAGFDPARLGRVRAVLQAHIDRDKFAGFNVMVARNGIVALDEQIGYQDVEAGIPMSPDTLFRIYSMTKPVVCTALMMLFEEGAFRMADPLSKFIPAFGEVRVLEQDPAGGTRLVAPARPILMSDLFTHTSGLTYAFLEDSPVCALYRQAGLLSNATLSLEDAIDELARLPLAFHPGSRWHYSVSIDVLGRVIEVLSGQSLPDFLRDRVFVPLGMSDTGFCVPAARRGHIAAMYGGPDIASPGMTASQLDAAGVAGYNKRADLSATYPADDPRFARGGHGLFSTARDYLRFAQALLGSGELDGARILGRKTVDYMHTNHLPPAILANAVPHGLSSGYGFGLGSRVLMDVGLSDMPGTNGEYGWGGAAATYYWIDPRESMAGVLMTQYMSAPHMAEKTFQAAVYQALI